MIAPERLQQHRLGHQTEVEKHGIEATVHGALGVQRLPEPLRVEDAPRHQEFSEASVAHRRQLSFSCFSYLGRGF